MMNVDGSNIRTLPITSSGGEMKTLGDYADQVVLIVNVASKCGLTPQYEALEELQKQYGARGFTVLGFPCNQFLGQEPGSMDEILEYCSLTWGVTFPIFQKVKVNGRAADPIFKILKKAKDENGIAGPVLWNFEKFLLSPTGEIIRFRPKTLPTDPRVISAIEAHLPK